MTRKEALKIIKEFINGTCLHLVHQKALETLIPELAESEDERIRKFLIDYFEIIKSTLSDDGVWKGFQIEDILAYIEKQKEQPTNDVYDSLTNEQPGVDLENTAHLIAIETLNDAKFMTTTMGYVLGKLQDIFIAGAEWGAEHFNTLRNKQ